MCKYNQQVTRTRHTQIRQQSYCEEKKKTAYFWGVVFAAANWMFTVTWKQMRTERMWDCEETAPPSLPTPVISACALWGVSAALLLKACIKTQWQTWKREKQYTRGKSVRTPPSQLAFLPFSSVSYCEVLIISILNCPNTSHSDPPAASAYALWCSRTLQSHMGGIYDRNINACNKFNLTAPCKS